jgi:hypothetical protein
MLGQSSGPANGGFLNRRYHQRLFLFLCQSQNQSPNHN